MEQREIKFRIWDGKAMTYPYEMYGDLRGETVLTIGGETYSVYEESNGQYCPDSLAVKAVEVTKLQYVGLKDKDNKPIYEGDVVKVFDWGIRDKGNVIGIGEVYWDSEDAGWNIKSIKENEYFIVENRYDLFNKATFEIIGNIYEQIH